MASDTQPQWCVHCCDVVFAGRMTKRAAVMCSSPGSIPRLLFSFLCRMVRGWHANRKWVFVWCTKRLFSDAASVPRSRMVPACSTVTPGSFPRPLSLGSCDCYHLWWFSRPHGDVTATHVCLHVVSTCSPLKSLELMLWPHGVQQKADGGRQALTQTVVDFETKMDTWK